MANVTNTNVYNRNKWLFNRDTIKLELNDLINMNLNELINIYIEMLDITQLDQFKNDIKSFDIFRILINNGVIGVIFSKDKKEMYISEINLKNDYELNENYHFKSCFITSPYLIEKLGQTEFTINKDIYLIRNNKYMSDDLSRLYNASSQLAQCDLTIDNIIFKMRLDNLFQTDTPEGKQALIDMFNQVYNGSILNCIQEDLLTNANSIKQFNFDLKEPKDILEFKNFIRSYALISMSLNANYNMKRESLQENETAVQYDSLSPYIDNRLDTIKEDLENIYNLTGVKLDVKLNSAWSMFMKEMEQNLKQNELLNNDDLKPSNNSNTEEIEEKEETEEKEGEKENEDNK